MNELRISLYRANEFLRNPDLCDKTAKMIESLLTIINDLQGQIEAKDSEIDGLYEEVEETGGGVSCLEDEIDDLKAEIKELKAELKECAK